MGDAARKLDYEKAIDTRTNTRASAYVCIDVFSDHNFWTGLTMNMSEGGVFIATHHEVPVGTTIVLHMSLPFEDEPIVTLGEVRWARAFSNESDTPPGVGVQFVGLDGNAAEKVKKFVATGRAPLFFED